MSKETKETFRIRKAIYKGYRGKGFRKLFEDEFNGLLGTAYIGKDYKDLIKTCRVKSDFERDLRIYQGKFYAESKAFTFANAAYNLTNMGFSILRKLYQHYKGGAFLDYGAGVGNCNILVGGGDYLELGGIAFKTAEKRFTDRLLPVVLIKARSDRYTKLDKMYDFIVCTDVLEHVPFAHKLITNLCSQLNPNGKLLITYSFGTADKNKTHLPKYNKRTGREILKIIRDSDMDFIDKDFKGIVKVYKKRGE